MGAHLHAGRSSHEGRALRARVRVAGAAPREEHSRWCRLVGAMVEAQSAVVIESEPSDAAVVKDDEGEAVAARGLDGPPAHVGADRRSDLFVGRMEIYDTSTKLREENDCGFVQTPRLARLPSGRPCTSHGAVWNFLTTLTCRRKVGGIALAKHVLCCHVVAPSRAESTVCVSYATAAAAAPPPPQCPPLPACLRPPLHPHLWLRGRQALKKALAPGNDLPDLVAPRTLSRREAWARGWRGAAEI